MNVLMTGADGFIGGNFLRVFSSCHDKNDLFLLTLSPVGGYKNIDYFSFKFDKRDIEKIGKIDVLLLLGAFVERDKNEPHLVRKHLSSIESIEYLLTHLPSAPGKVVYCSSIAVYGADSSLPYYPRNEVLDEESNVNPVRTYALSKIFCERLVSEWCRENNVKCQIVRIGSVYNSTFNNGFLGYAIKACKNNEVFRLSAPLSKLWNYVHVDDVCQWIVNSLYLKETPGVINLTSNSNFTTLEIVELIKACNPSFQYEIIKTDLQFGVDNVFNSKKREKYLGPEEHSLKQLFI